MASYTTITTTPVEPAPTAVKTPTEQAQAVIARLEDPDGIAFWAFLQHHQLAIKEIITTYQANALAHLQQTSVDTKELTRLRRLVKNYFAEFFLASMYLTGMFLAVIYMLAHTWR